MRTPAGHHQPARAALHGRGLRLSSRPSANPPTKQPLLTLLKQARAFGLGVVLTTQNPVDLDYKGLTNAGTWFIGKLQTERDKQRLLDGLEGVTAEAAPARPQRSGPPDLVAGQPRLPAAQRAPGQPDHLSRPAGP